MHTWRGDHNLYARSQYGALGTLGGTAIDTGVLDARGGTKLLALLLDLDGQLPCGGQHQHDGAIPLLCTAAVGNVCGSLQDTNTSNALHWVQGKYVMPGWSTGSLQPATELTSV